jgi:cation:H+ antiporter
MLTLVLLPPAWSAPAARHLPGDNMPQLPVWLVPTLVFSAALGVALRASAGFTRVLEDLGDQWGMSPGLLSFLSALGANIPNYAASLSAFAGGHGSVGLGIIVGSNIYNLAVILGLVTFASPGGHGITLASAEIPDVRRVARLAASMALTTWLTFVLWGLGHATSLPLALPLAAIADVLALCLFLGLIIHALQRVPRHEAVRSTFDAAVSRSTVRLPILSALALTLALAGVIVMVRAGEVAGAEVHLPTPLLSLVVLAVATSLPNTVVAYQLARTARTSACVEEILSSNGINLALGIAVPLLLWRDGIMADFLLLWLDMPLLCILGLVALALVRMHRIPRLVGAGLLAAYALWVVVHVLA